MGIIKRRWETGEGNGDTDSGRLETGKGRKGGCSPQASKSPPPPQCFFNHGLMVDVLTELSGDDERPGGALLRQVDVPPHLKDATYGELFAFLVVEGAMVPLGLYRRKSENPAWRLPYVATNPLPDTPLRPGDRVFVLRERPEPRSVAP